MIISKVVELTWSARIKRHYTEKGYKFTKMGDIFEVKIEDLTDASSALIHVQCEYGGETSTIPYKDYVRTAYANEYVKKYCCTNCIEKKIKDILDTKQKLGLLNKGDPGYWTYEENVIKELKTYIEENGSIESVSINDQGLHTGIKYFKKGKELHELLEEWGFEWEKISNRKPVGFHLKFENGEKEIRKFIDRFNRFPTYSELKNEVGLCTDFYVLHGGVEAVKNKMGYTNKNESYLIDSRGFKNSSLAEFMLAQFLIKNRISYKREVEPFQGKRYRSDFSFRDKDNNIAHIELWGYYKGDSKSKRSTAYNNRREKKEGLYKSTGTVLVSVEFSEIDRKTHRDIQKYFKEVLDPFLKTPLQTFDDSLFMSPYNKTGRKIYQEIISLTEDASPPNISFLRKKGYQRVLSWIVREYGDYESFLLTYKGARDATI